MFTEIPLDWASNHKTKSNVEMYVQTPQGDVLKAVCDSSGTQATTSENKAVFWSNHKGNENDCSFEYSTNATALVLNSTIISYDNTNHTETIQITGKGFSKSRSNITKAIITIGNSDCKIITIIDSEIICTVQNVPGGQYQPVVNIPGLGYAFHDAFSPILIFNSQIFGQK